MLEDGNVFYYSISPYELKNSLGHSIAVLQEYNFAKRQVNAASLSANYRKQKMVDGRTLKTQ